MKKTLVALVLVMAMVFSFAACGDNTKKDDVDTSSTASTEDVVGGYTEEREPTADEIAMFDKVMGEVTGVGYEPLKVATQVVAGTNYKFYCKTTTMDADATEGYAYVTIFEPLEGEPELGDITEA